MLSLYLKTSLRHLRKNRLYAFINMAGLAAGITTMLLAILFRGHETTFDRFHKNYQNIYRITTTLKESKDSEKVTVGATGQVQGPAFLSAIPEIRSFTRVMGGDIFASTIANNNTFSLRPLYVDSNFLEVFSFPLVQGNSASALDDKSRVVLTETTARKLFGTTDVVGKLITMEADPAFEKLGKPLLVSAVVKDPRAKSSLQFDMLFPFSYMQLSFTDHAWLNAYLGTFIVLNPSANPKTLPAKFQEVYKQHSREQLAANIKEYQFDPEVSYGVQQIADIHLNPLMRTSGNAEAGVINGSDSMYSIIFLVISGFILLMASINFININIAGSLKRSKEVGIRKISGGSVKQIVYQFLTESSIVCGVAFIVSVAGMYLLLPYFNELTAKQFAFSEVLTFPILFSFVALLVFIVCSTGLYPAFILSRFKPVEVLYNKQQQGKNTTGKILVVLQFIPAIFLLITALIYYQQMNFVRTKSLGYNPDHVIKSGIYGDRDYVSAKTILINELATEPAIKAISFGNTGYNFHLDVNHKYFEAIHKTTDDRYLPLMEIPIIAGRNFTTSPADKHAAIVNETFVKTAGLENPIGASVKLSDYYGNKIITIIGVVKDHHHESVRHKIAPLVMFAPDRDEGDMWVKLDKSRMNEGIEALERVYKQAMPSAIFQYSFLDEMNAREFMQEKRWQQAIGIGTFLSLMICCLGLFGLAHLSAWQRVKEIGIRKVLGASVGQIMLLLSSGFMKMVITSFLIAAPIALFVMNRWLQDFAYRIDISAGIFIVAAVAAVTVSLIAVFYQSFKAASADPVRALRKE